MEEAPARRGRPTRAQVIQRNENVIEVARGLFMRQGYAATSLHDIARRARVAARTLYQDYGNKEGLFGAIVRHELKRLEEDGAGVAPPAGADLRQRLRRLADSLVETCLSDRAVSLQRLIVAESVRFPAMTTAVTTDGFRNVIRVVEAVFAEADARGELRVPDPGFAAAAFVDLTVGWSLLFAASGLAGARPSPAVLERRIDLFLGGLADVQPA